MSGLACVCLDRGLLHLITTPFWSLWIKFAVFIISVPRATASAKGMYTFPRKIAAETHGLVVQFSSILINLTKYAVDTKYFSSIINKQKS